MGHRPEEEVAAALAGRYVVERAIGRGGMATVYLATDTRLRRHVAIKVFTPEISSALGHDRFLHEIDVVAKLNHPHILALHDSGEADGLLFFVMPYVGGESLRQALDRRKRFPVAQTVRLTEQVASALEYAHSHGVIHRDIKPENIVLHEGEAMVMDFGIARAVNTVSDASLTGTGVVIGTPAYMSPEQAMGHPGLDARSDVYSLGCVVYEMLAGAPPFTGTTALELISTRLTESVPSVRQRRAEVPTEIDQALQKALARNPADRFSTPTAFSTALTTPQAPRIRSVAVLPFVNLSGDSENEYFADGMTEDVIAQLSKVPALKVISRTSVMAFKKRDHSLREISAKLNAETLLDGSVRRAGNRVRIVAQLIDAATDQHLWAETYDRQLTDIFAIQTDVALHIAAALNAELSPEERTRIRREPTNDLEAYQLYLQGRYCLLRFTEEGLHKAVGFFERAIQRDDQYALAYAGVALAYAELAEAGALPAAQAFPRAKEAAAAALARDSELAEAHCMVAHLKVICDLDWAGAEAEFKRALELSPSSADSYDLYARMCGGLERYDESIALVQRAQELDPLAHRSDLATALLRAGRYDEALQAAKKAAEFDPHYYRAHATLGWAYFKKGMIDQGLAELQQAVALSSGHSTWLAQLGQALAMAGKVDEARDILRQLHERARERHVSPYHFAYVCTGLGEYDAAMDWLERAYEERGGALYGIKGSFLFAPLRSHPRFAALLKKMRLA